MNSEPNARYQVVTTAVGAVTIRHMELGETIHPSGPLEESRETYVKQSRLKAKLLSQAPSPVVIYDVGLGGGANSSAAFLCWQKLKAEGVNPRNLEIYSFENDLSVFTFALENIPSFPHLKGLEEILQTLSQEKIYEMLGVRWEILEGDFHDRFSPLASALLPPAEIIFHDPYSPLKNPGMWDLKTFKKLREKSTDDCILVTFSQATRIRAAMMVAGFYVGSGSGLGMKRESTVASPTLSLLEKPLGSTWIEKWRKSEAPYPVDVSLEDRADFKDKIESFLF